MPTTDSNNDVAVFFDFENIAISLQRDSQANPNFEALMDRCQEFGRVVMARAYADWSRHTPVIPPLQASGFDPIYVPTYFYGQGERNMRKNAVDIHIAIEAVEVLYTRDHVDTFVLLTGDKDFIPLANALRRHGKRVIAVGVQGTTSPYLQQAVDDFYFYNEIFGTRRERQSEANIYEALVAVVTDLQQSGKRAVLPNVKYAMSERLGGFDEKKHRAADGSSFKKFKDFVVEAQRQGLVRLETTGTVNEVLLPLKSSQAAPRAGVKSADGQEPPDLSAALALLLQATRRAAEQNKSQRAASIKSIMRSLDSDFDEKLLVGPDGDSFRRFTDFARAAEDQGLVTLHGQGKYIEIWYAGQAAAQTDQVAEKSSTAVDAPDSPTEPESPAAFVLHALRTQALPAAALPIDRRVQSRRDEEGADVSNRRIHQLLGRAVKIGLLQAVVDSQSAAPLYQLIDEPDTVRRFLDNAE